MIELTNTFTEEFGREPIPQYDSTIQTPEIFFFNIEKNYFIKFVKFRL